MGTALRGRASEPSDVFVLDLSARVSPPPPSLFALSSSHAIVLSFSTHLSSSSRAGRSNGCVPPLQMRGALRWCLAALHSRNNKTKYTVAAGPFRVELQRAIRSNRVVDLME